MLLKKLKFCRFKGEKGEWSIEGKPQNNEFGQWLTLEHINLIVGRNATGKSKTIDAIRQIADLLCGDAKPSDLVYDTGIYDLEFDDNGVLIEYHLDFKKAKVVQETLKVGGFEKLNRAEGRLYYDEAKNYLSFETDDNILALNRRDSKQQPFFENLYLWGKNLTHYRFGSKLGKSTLLRDINSIKDEKEPDLKDGDDVTEIFLKGKRQFENVFVQMIIDDMKRVSYNINEVDAVSLKLFPVSAFGLGVNESDLDEFTDQREMSQGMFRVLSLLTQLNYSLLTKRATCILIDDIGEGLDFDRSKSLIELLIGKVKDSSLQLIMTTNDRFVMNKIPLQYWSVIQRIPKKSLFYNYNNSKDIFDEFKYTGLNNFDFLSTEFYLTGYEKQVN